MPAGAFTRFRRLDVLSDIGRNLLTTLLDPFAADLAARNTPIPAPGAPDAGFFQAIADIFASPAPLPAGLTEALSAIEEMTAPEGRQHIHAALLQLQSITPTLHPSITPRLESPDPSPEKAAVQVWLALPQLLASLETYTLEPLRSEGQDSLSVAGIEGITKITLREIEVTSDNAYQDVAVRKSDDLFKQTAAHGPAYNPIPKTGRLSHATFDIQFADSTTPRAADIRPPHALKPARKSDTQAIQTWLSKRGFLLPTHDPFSHANLVTV